MLTVQDWIDAGYRAYRQKTHNLSDYLLQKCISDEKGKMFYINVWVYEHFNKEYFKNNRILQRWDFHLKCNSRGKVKLRLIVV